MSYMNLCRMHIRTCAPAQALSNDCGWAQLQNRLCALVYLLESPPAFTFHVYFVIFVVMSVALHKQTKVSIEISCPLLKKQRTSWIVVFASLCEARISDFCYAIFDFQPEALAFHRSFCTTLLVTIHDL